MGSRTSRIGSDRSSQPSRMKRTKRMLSSLLLCGRTSSSTSHPSVLELESPINSIENLPPASVESISSAGVSSPFFGSEPICTSSKSSESEPEGSETHTIEEPMLGNHGLNHGSDPVSGLGPQIAVNDVRPMTSSSINVTQENLDTDENSGQNHSDVSPRSVDSNTRALLVLSDSFLSLRMFGSSITTSGSGILVVESGSLSPDINSREARRNAGGLSGLFGPVSSRRRYRRESNFPSLLSNFDDFGSRDRWLLDINDDDHHHGHGHGHGYYRSFGRNDERRHFRSQMMSERGLGGVNEEARLCASGLHRDGSCSCVSSFMGEEAAGTLGTISRVVLLAQALSEVLEEIHRQPLSLSMPMLSLPAPESVVDSFLLKSHKKMNESETGPNYVQQCYICLVDYEEGDKIRVLPCQHEYHAPCVDKWLKEVNGVCPVCRCNVCDTQGSVSTSELPAL